MISTGVILIALSAALLHATWNAMVKGATDRALSIGLVSLGHYVPALPFFFNPSRAGYGRAALHYCLNGDPLGLLLFPDRSL